MALPSKKISKIKTDSSNTYDIVTQYITDGSTNYSLTAPTLISDNDKIVTTNTAQTISGAKIFDTILTTRKIIPVDSGGYEIGDSTHIYGGVTTGYLKHPTYSTLLYVPYITQSGDITVPGTAAKYVYNSQLDDAFWDIGKRYYVILSVHPKTVNGVTYPYEDTSKQISDDNYIVDSTPINTINSIDQPLLIHQLFDGSADTGDSTINRGRASADNYIKIRIIPVATKQDNYSPASSTSTFPGYPYGKFILTTYYGDNATKVMYATYNKHSSWPTGWYITNGVKGNDDRFWTVDDGGHYSRTVMDFWFIGDGDSAKYIRPTALYWIKNRVTDISNENSYFSKYVDEELVNSIIWKERGVQKAKIQPNGIAEFSGLYLNNVSLSTLSTGASNKDKYLHTNASTGALEWSSVSSGANYYATSDFTSSNGTKIATGYSSGTASATYDLYAPNATASQAGLVTTGAQTFAGAKTFNDTILLNGTGGAVITSSGSNIQNNVINGGMVIENTGGGYTSYGKTGIGGMTDDSNTFNLNFPSKSGTITVDADIIGRQIKEVDAVTQPTNSSNYVVYHITDSTITSLTEGLTIRVHKGLASSWPKDSSGAIKLIQINNLDPIAIFWRYNSFASWNSFDNVMMTLTYSATARPSSSDYYGYKSQAGFILDFTYDSGNDTYNLYDYGGYHTGSSALTAYSLVGWDDAGNRVPVINADGTAGVAFDYSRGVQYWETAINANQNRSPWTGSAWYPRVTATILSSLITRYNFGTLATTDRIYIKCSKSGMMLTPIELTKTLPSTKDSYYYMLFAKPYQEYTNYTSNQTWTIFINQPIYYYNGSAVVPLESDDSNVVHKGTSSSSVAETIYGNKTFANKVDIYNGFEFRNADYTYAPTMITSSSNGLKMQFNTGSQYLQLSATPAGYINIQPNAGSVGVISNQYIKDNATLVTNTLNLPNASGTLALDGDIVHKGSSSSSVAEDIYGAKTFKTGGSLNTNVIISGGYGSQSGYEADAIGGLMLIGAASGLYGKATLLLAHANYNSSTSSPTQIYLPNKTGTLATTSDLPQILDYRS